MKKKRSSKAKAKARAEAQAQGAPPASPKVAMTIIAITLIIAGVLIFARLGYYTLWDDESETALTAEGVLRTGDTSAWVGNGNIVAYRGGIHIKDFCNRTMPPLPAYLTAASFAVFGQDSWAARFPSALAGLATFALLLYWARRKGTVFQLLFALGLLGNVSMILFCRQCRYYAFALLLTSAIIFIYMRARPVARNLLAIAALSSLLFACQYLNFIALYACLAVDYLVWKRKEWPPDWKSALCLFGPQLVVNGLVAWVWNPLGTSMSQYEAHAGIFDRITVLFWFWRDTNQAEFFSLLVLIAAFCVGLAQRRTWMVRGCVAVAVFITLTALIAPQIVRLSTVADVRYAVPVIPLAIALEAATICALCPRPAWLAIVAGMVVFGSNLLNGGPLLRGGLQFTIYRYAAELIHPVPEPYTPTADWLNANVPDGSSVFVLPDYSTYPLMFRAPRCLYAWQFDWPPRADFAGLPDIQFKGRQAPDYLITFGPEATSQMMQGMQNWNRPDVRYNEVVNIPVYWRDMYRPELFWRTFTPITGFDPSIMGIHILKRVSPPIVPAARP